MECRVPLLPDGIHLCDEVYYGRERDIRLCGGGCRAGEDCADGRESGDSYRRHRRVYTAVGEAYRRLPGLVAGSQGAYAQYRQGRIGIAAADGR